MYLDNCSSDEDCHSYEDGITCVDEHCRNKSLCSDSHQCRQNEICFQGVCTSSCPQNLCENPTLQCIIVNHKIHCKCNDTLSFLETGMFCQSNIETRKPCNTTAQCGGSSLVCNSNNCVPDCNPESTNGSCLNDVKCSDGVCRPNYCVLDQDCNTRQFCKDNKCANLCSHNYSCGIRAICEAHDHKIHCTCPSGLTGDARIGCIKSKSVCLYDSDCTHGICHKNECRITCIRL